MVGDIFDRQRDGGLAEFWEVHAKMLEAVGAAIPNLSKRVRVISGFSNGAHSIGGYCSQVEESFGSQFNVFVFGDGGVYGSDWSFSAFKGAHAYCTRGEESANKRMTMATADVCEEAKMEAVRSEMVATGHKFTDEEKAKVKT